MGLYLITSTFPHVSFSWVCSTHGINHSIWEITTVSGWSQWAVGCSQSNFWERKKAHIYRDELCWTPSTQAQKMVSGLFYQL